MVRIHRSEAMSKKGTRILKDMIYAIIITLAINFIIGFLGVSTEPPAIWVVIYLLLLTFIGASRVIY